MTTGRLFRTSVLVTIVWGGCGDVAGTVNLAESEKNITNYSSHPNGTGIHVGSTEPESWFGLTNISLTWFMDGFSQHSDGSWWATGWYSIGVGLLSADAELISAEINGASLGVQAIRTTGSRLSVDLRDSLGNVQTLQDSALIGLSFLLSVPDPVGLTHTNYLLRIATAETLSSQFSDVYAYQMEYVVAGLLGATTSSSCIGPNNESQRSVFYQGSQWNPMNAERSDGMNLVTMTCESGAVATCMRWGYRPWGSGQDQTGQTASFADYHQACIHMKRASYCGDSQTYTLDGTPIFISDELSPPINSGSMALIEALWTTTGATCVSNRRHPEFLFLGCPLPLPNCPSDLGSSYLLADGLVPAGVLARLTD